ANGAAYLLAFLTAALGAMSYVHARANLRGLRIEAGVLPPIQAGRQGTLPLIVRAASGQSPCGIELLAVGAGRALLVEGIKSGETERVALALPPQEEGVQQRIRLLVRSTYPLGLFAAERMIEITCLRRVHPRPAGDQPLPAPDPTLRQEALAFAGTSALAAGEGDDFAGLREWQVGDSPRHIDWRAVARGRPLMVKTWAGSAPEAIRLDWQSIQGPNTKRSGQMAKWIELCERQGVPYSLRLPGCEVPLGLGPAQAQRCLNALADFSTQSAAQVEDDAAKPARVPASYEHSAHLPGRPLALLSAGLLLAALPLWEFISQSSLLLLAACLVWRLLRGGTRVRSWVPAAVAAAGITSVFVQQGAVLSTEAGIGVLVVLQGCKLIEARSPHDFQVLAMIGWFLCLCGLLAEQSLERSLYTVAIFAYITVCMIRFRRSRPGMAAPMRLGGTLLMQAFPIAIALFLIFPRGSIDEFARRLGTGRTTVTGVPSELDPAAICRLAMSDASAFRVKFPTGKVPPNQQRYWRCVVLWDCDGLKWKRGGALGYAPRPEFKLEEQDIRQEIDMEPHGQYWLPGLDRPQRGQSDRGALVMDYDDTLIAREVVRRPQRIHVVSRPLVEGGALPEAHRRAALQLPPLVPAKLRALAGQWRASVKTDGDVIQTALVYLRSQGFTYTLDPGEFNGPDGFEEFWFRRKTGFCGHYSAAFATMMRLAGIPTRVVMGYVGGTWNERGNYLLVRQSDAHAWVEIWLDSNGWTRIDPTAVLVPNRLNLDLQGSLLGDEEALNRQRNSLWWRTYQSARMFWDNVSYQWNTYVIRFDEESQVEWLSYLGMNWLSQGRLRGPVLLSVSGAFVIVSLGLLALWLRRPARHRDPWARAWQRFCRRLVRLGIPERQLSEGPLAYARRVAPDAPAISGEVLRLAGIYAAARYGEQDGSLREFYRSVRRLKARRDSRV
ncbi:MAG: transglutaminaseTgpA domain-containing protein, partial [Prosthecobacter sp.]|nr:transglutaminaseTgpA domain-containing protein [Prosthecobacter sp.]